MTQLDNVLYLHELNDSELEDILSLSDDSLEEYIDLLIEKFYPHVSVEENEDLYFNLVTAYITSFHFEKVYRNNHFISGGFTCTYTSTGLIKEITNDLYHIPETSKNNIN